MRLRLQLKIMTVALRKSGFRSLLALGAVALGIASMMIMLALSAGAERELQTITEQIGKNLLTVRPAEALAVPGRGEGWFTSRTLKQPDVVAMREEIPEISTIVPVVEGLRQARLNGEELVTTIRGVTAEYLEIRNFELAEGRFLDKHDLRARSRVAVVGQFVAEKLNDGFSMVGERILISDIPFEVIGQLEKKGLTFGQNEDDQILLPLDTVLRRVFNVDYFSYLLVQVESRERMNTVQQECRAVLRERHGLGADAKDDFEILRLVRANQIRSTNSAFLQGLSQLFALFTLAIGGAGVLAVTYLNAKDRTSEIGLRRAIGARKRDIATLFVAEACLLSAAGGIVGLLIGWLAVSVLGQVTAWEMAIDFRGVTVPLLVSVFLGLAFGVLPGAQAARVTPVDALRYS